MIHGKALYPFGTGCTATYRSITSAQACSDKCVAEKQPYGCEWDPSANSCCAVKGPITDQRAPGGWPSWGCRMHRAPNTPQKEKAQKEKAQKEKAKAKAKATCTMIHGKALYPFGTGCTATYRSITSAQACSDKCVAEKQPYGCEWDPSANSCCAVKGPITDQRAPGGWPSWGCRMHRQ